MEKLSHSLKQINSRSGRFKKRQTKTTTQISLSIASTCKTWVVEPIAQNTERKKYQAVQQAIIPMLFHNSMLKPFIYFLLGTNTSPSH